VHKGTINLHVIFILLFCFSIFSSCGRTRPPICNTTAALGVSTNPEIITIENESVDICPGERAILTWATSEAESVNIITDVSTDLENLTPEGQIDVSPASRTEFNLRATSGTSCEAGDTALVNVVQQGDTRALTLSISAQTPPTWSIIVPSMDASQNIIVTDLSLITEPQSAAMSDNNWTIQHTDANGQVNVVSFTGSPVSLGSNSFPYVGDYAAVWNVTEGTSAGRISRVHLNLTIRCR